MKSLLALLLIVVLALCLTACGGGGTTHSVTTSTSSTTSSQTTTAPTPNPQPQGAACDFKHDFSIQCHNSDLFTQNPLRTGGKASAAATVFGTDTYGGAANVASNPATRFDVSYLSGVPGKDWTVGDLQAWHAQGKPTGFVWEQGAAQATLGCHQGTVDADRALAEANALGAPSYSVIHAAVDSGVSGDSVKSYFECWEHVLGPVRAGDYGSYFVVRDLNEWGIISGRATWQTRAWSEGMRYNNACLYQYAIPPMDGTSLSGTGVDRDVASCADWGQFPYAQAPPVNPLHYDWMPDTKHTFYVKGGGVQPCKKGSKGCHTITARERLNLKQFDHTGCVLDKTTHHFKRHACKTLARHARLLGGRIYHIAHRSDNLKQKAKTPRWNAIHYKTKTHKTTLGAAYQQFVHRLHATSPIKSF